MNKLFTTGLLASLVAVTCVSTVAPALAEGVIGASSEATCNSGFPVLTGPGATVLTPSGAFTMGMSGPTDVYNPRQKDYSETGVTEVKPEPKPEIKAQVKNYSWGQGSRASVNGGYAYRYDGSRRVAASKFFTQY